MKVINSILSAVIGLIQGIIGLMIIVGGIILIFIVLYYVASFIANIDLVAEFMKKHDKIITFSTLGFLFICFFVFIGLLSDW